MKFFAALTIFSGVSSAAVIYPPYPYQPANLTVKRTTVNNVKRASAKDATLGMFQD